MKIDTLFPPPPQFNQPPLRCDDITPPRQRALDRLSQFAAIGESFIGLNGDGIFPGTARGFVPHCFLESPHAEELAALLSSSKRNITECDEVDAPHVMVINPRKWWGVLGPLRGDVVVYADGHVALVTKPLCMGCQHFEAVTLGGEPPVVAKVTQWLSAVKMILRLIDESEPSAQCSVFSEPPDMASPEVRAALDAESPPAKKPRRKLKGIGE